MKAVELMRNYDPKDFEERIYSEWKEKGEFGPVSSDKEHFSVVMPPPNVTGILHMGHALNNSLQDIIVRYQRMHGRPTLWVPGTDHAGIATQNVVERQLQKEGLRRQDLGREKFIERTWSVKEKHHDIITKQLEKMGCSCDWKHERFTMDEGLSRAVREAFVTLYERGLIYKGMYLVNYCPKCGTALADDEVEYENVPGKLYDVQYPYADGSGYITVATTRPETMFGDVAVAVNPDDERYKSVVGKELLLPLTDRRIPIIIDRFVDMEFGTGMVKITPAHDPNDWECGKRHNLEAINLLNPDGTLNENVPEKYRGMKAEEARALVVDDLKEGGYLVKITDHAHDVGHCYRCHTTVEPYLSEQWFVSMKTLADKALKAWKDGDIVFYPRRWENTYQHWMENIRDWCISRQLWWGHRIPVWYCQDCGKMIVSRTDPDECPDCHSHNLKQDSDVLDTWFSSWLWPFSTLGWPDKTPDLEKFFPTNTLVSAYDIIFFWISRMIMASEEFLGKAPFHDIVITGLVRDIQGRKMSKSLGNVVDPDEIIKKYGADTARLFILFAAPPEKDLDWSERGVEGANRFLGRVWRLVEGSLDQLKAASPERVAMKDITLKEERDMKRVIHSTLDRVTKDIRDERQFNTAVARLMELANALIAYAPADEKGWSVKREGVETLLCCLSPFAPHITEELWHMLGNDSFLSVHKWFEVDETALVEDSVTIVLQINGKVREQFTVPAGLSKEDLLAEVMGREETKKRVEGKEIVKTIAVPGKLVNIVVKG